MHKTQPLTIGAELRNRLRALGASSLSDAELIAVARYQRPQDHHIAEAIADYSRASGLEGVLASDPRLAAARELVTRALGENLTRGPALSSPDDSGEYIRARLRHLPYEVFACLYLDNRHRVLAFEELFRGTIDGASVHPREVVRACLKHNAAAVIFAHNHPSGVAEPSHADRDITRTLRETLQLVGVRVLDHLVVGAGAPVSMAARGLI